MAKYNNYRKYGKFVNPTVRGAQRFVGNSIIYPSKGKYMKYVKVGLSGVQKALPYVAPFVKPVFDYYTKPKNKPKVQRGQTGKRIKKIPNVKKKDKKIKKFNKAGVSINMEDRGQVSSTHCAYIVHTQTPQRKVLELLCANILKKLMKRIGIDIKDMNEFYYETDTQTDIEWIITYYARSVSEDLGPDENPRESSLSSSTTTVLKNANTYWSLAKNMANLLSGLESLDSHRLNKAVLRKLEPGVEVNRDLAVMYLDDMNVSIYGESELKYQNSTLASDGAGDEYDENNVNANPLKYCIFEGKSWSTGIVNNYRMPGQTNGNYGFITNPSSGHYTLDPVSISAGNLLKIPPAWHLKTPDFKTITNKYSGTIDPGVINTSKSIFNCDKIKINNLFGRLDRGFTTTGNRSIALGRTRVIAFEHLLRSTSDAAITVNYEHNIKLNMAIFKAKTPPTAQIVEVNDN